MITVTATIAISIIVVGEQKSFKQMPKEAIVSFEVLVVGVFGVLNFSGSHKKLKLLL